MKQHDLKNEDFILDEIESITLVGEGETVDITVDDSHMFYANDIYTHNCSAEDDIVQGHSVADSYRKVMTSDFIMSLSRKIADKTSNTARFHVIKNRFGSDGITMPASMNTSNGDIRIYLEKSDEGQVILQNMKDGEKNGKKQLFNKFQSFLNNKKPTESDDSDF